MVALITDQDLEDRLVAQRRANGTDKFDEVWDGVYVIAPMANNEHQDLVDELCTILTIVVKWQGLGRVNPGVNVSDRTTNWQENYRCPDVAVFLNDTTAEDRNTHWLGGPDLAIEVVSPLDRTYEKLPFYAKVGVRELLIIERDPWAMIQYQLIDAELKEVSRSTNESAVSLASQVVPLAWQLQSTDGRLAIQVTHTDGKQSWSIALPATG